jgi:hypothetical protein
MTLQKLPITGDYIDPEVSKIGAIFLRKSAKTDQLTTTSAVVIISTIANQQITHVLDCKTDDEAESIRDSLAVRFGFYSDELSTKNTEPSFPKH